MPRSALLPALGWLLTALGGSVPAQANVTTLAVDIQTAMQPAPDAPSVAHYSEAVHILATLFDGAGFIEGETVDIYVRRVADPDSEFLLTSAVTGANGQIALARLTLVDGRHGGRTFPAAAPGDDLGEAYAVRAEYAGDLDEGDPACSGAPDSGAGPDEYCSSDEEIELFVALETPMVLTIQPGIEVGIGEATTLVALLEDPDGDAAAGGTDLNGTEALPVGGAEIAFFFDLDGNGAPSLDEKLGSSVTDTSGVARFDFLADPQFIPAGDADNGIQVQFGGNDRYALIGDGQTIRVLAGPPDAKRTVIEAEPETVVADGVTLVELKAILVDEANNPIDVDAPPPTVKFKTDLGFIEGDEAKRDDLTGHFLQSLRAPGSEGTATVTVIVDGDKGSKLEIEFTPREGGCQCIGASSSEPGPGSAAFALMLVMAWRRRR